MSGPKRAMRIASGYIGRAGDLLSREWDRIQGVERESAEKELTEAIYDAQPVRAKPEESGVEIVEITAEHTVRARQLLGVSEDAEFESIRKAFERLNKRCGPSKFPEGSAEREQASQIQKRVHWAYQVLTEQLNVTEKRFRSLEIE